MTLYNRVLTWVFTSEFYGHDIKNVLVDTGGNYTFNHPPYSPDLAPSDYYLFQNLKAHPAEPVYQMMHVFGTPLKKLLEEQSE